MSVLTRMNAAHFGIDWARSRLRAAWLAIGVCAVVPASATLVSGNQSGTWSLAGSPYELVGNVIVATEQTLTIEPGVTVRALGHYGILVNGTLLAIGDDAQPILMTAADTVAGWRGLRLEFATDSSELAHCIVEYTWKNSSDWMEVRGGAIYVGNCSPTIRNCELRNNYTRNANANGCGGGLSVEYSDAQVLDNYIHANTSDSGGGVCCLDYGQPVVRGNTIVDNTGSYAGGGLYAGARNEALIENNVIVGNTAGGWGGGGINSWTSYIYYGTYATIRNNVICDNVCTAAGDAAGGGGLYCRYDRAVVTGNVIADNQSPRGGGVYVLNYPDQAPLIRDTIIWGNTATLSAPQVFLYSGTSSAVSISYSDVQGGWSGSGNINQDPLFVDAVNGDYHLARGSPCIDHGDPAFVPDPGETDIDGQPRLLDGDANGSVIVDIGADEVTACPEDLTGDGAIDLDDLSILLVHFGMTSGAGSADGDLDGDGDIDLDDLSRLLVMFGGSCVS